MFVIHQTIHLPYQYIRATLSFHHLRYTYYWLGDIHATNTGERAYSIMTMLLGAMMFGAIIAKVREVIETRNLLSKGRH